MGAYAEGTTVDSAKSRMEIEQVVRRFGASDFAYASTGGGTKVMIGFVIQDRQVRFVLDMPDPKERRFTHHSRGPRTASAADAEYEQAIRQRWRALLLLTKAKLEAVTSGVSTVEQEFLANIMLPNGRNVYDNIRQGVEDAYLTGNVRPLLPLES